MGEALGSCSGEGPWGGGAGRAQSCGCSSHGGLGTGLPVWEKMAVAVPEGMLSSKGGHAGLSSALGCVQGQDNEAQVSLPADVTRGPHQRPPRGQHAGRAPFPSGC